MHILFHSKGDLHSNLIIKHHVSYLDHVINEKPYPHLFSAIKKQISHCNALEHLESSGTKAFMNKPIVHKLCEGGGGGEQRNRHLKMNGPVVCRLCEGGNRETDP